MRAAAYEAAGCSIDSAPLGAFGTSHEVFAAVGNDDLSFAIGEQQALQGALAVHLAAVYASTGKSLARPSSGAYLTGPHVVTKSTLPTDSLQVCEVAAWPVCPNEMVSGHLLIQRIILKTSRVYTNALLCLRSVASHVQAPDGSPSQCQCTERAKIKIGGVTHGHATDSFWDPVYAASAQAAFDLGVEVRCRPAYV